MYIRSETSKRARKNAGACVYKNTIHQEHFVKHKFCEVLQVHTYTNKIRERICSFSYYGQISYMEAGCV